MNMSRGGRELRFWGLVLAGFSFFLVAVVSPKYALNLGLKRRIARVEAEIDALQEEERRIEIEKKALREDPFYTESLARRELRLAKPGEEAIRVERSRSLPGKSGSPRQPSFEFYILVLARHRILQYFLMACAFGMAMAAILLFGEAPPKRNDSAAESTLSALKKVY